MTRDMFIDSLLLSAILPLFISIALYIRVPWHRTPLGRFFMGYHICMMLFWIFFLLLRHDVGLGRDFITNSAIVVFIAMSLFLWWGAYLMYRYTVRERERIDDLEEENRPVERDQ